MKLGPLITGAILLSALPAQASERLLTRWSDSSGVRDIYARVEPANLVRGMETVRVISGGLTSYVICTKDAPAVVSEDRISFIDPGNYSRLDSVRIASYWAACHGQWNTDDGDYSALARKYGYRSSYRTPSFEGTGGTLSGCEIAIHSVSQGIMNVPNASMFRLQANQSDRTQWLGYPSRRPMYLQIGVSGPGGESFMASTGIQLTMARQLIENCPNLAMVSMGMARTDWINTYGLVGGKVQQFKCISTSSMPRSQWSNPTTWGTKICL